MLISLLAIDAKLSFASVLNLLLALHLLMFRRPQLGKKAAADEEDSDEEMDEEIIEEMKKLKKDDNDDDDDDDYDDLMTSPPFPCSRNGDQSNSDDLMGEDDGDDGL